MSTKHNTQTPDLAGLAKIKSCLSNLKDLMETSRFPADNNILIQVGAVRNHGERFVMLVNELERMVATKQRFCDHPVTVRVDWNKFSTTRVCEHCRKVLVEGNIKEAPLGASEPIQAAV